MLRFTQYLCLVLGIVLLAWFKLDTAAMEVRSDEKIQLVYGALDQTLWSESRKERFEPGSVIGVLTIPEISLEVPVVPGVSPSSLEGGVGWMQESAGLNSAGNAVIAGHRDSFFRALKDVEAGMTIDLTTLHGKGVYHIDSIQIVSPDAVWVLADHGLPELTLITCYPFYHLGPAPDRLVVFASRLKS